MSIMWMYFFWSQYLVICYGNVRGDALLRGPFLPAAVADLAWVIFAMGWRHSVRGTSSSGLTGRPPRRATRRWSSLR